MEEVEKQSVYVSRHIRRIRLSENGESFCVEYDGCDDLADLRDKATRFLYAMLQSLRPIEVETIFRHQRADKGSLETDVYQKLLKRGWVVELGFGQVALSGPALALATVIERACAKVGREEFHGVERHYPTMIPTEVLARCGYINSFPQHLTTVHHLLEDFDAIEAFRKINGERHSSEIVRTDAFELAHTCLCPALCYHCYPTLTGQRLGPQGHVETSIGRIARYESSNIRGLDRLWEFSQRSIIWVGTQEFCESLRQKAIALAMHQAQEWDIDCTIETASDPFFAAVTTAKSFWQRSQNLKYEMRPSIEPGSSGEPRTIAAASFNLHDSFFGRAFDITGDDGEPASSGCVSWGLERWVLVLFTQHGFQAERWPLALRSEVFT